MMSRTYGGGYAVPYLPPAPTRMSGECALPWPPPHGEPDPIGRARREYVEGRIEADEFEAAVDHILRGGRGNERFPYLPMFPLPPGPAPPGLGHAERRAYAPLPTDRLTG